MEVGTGTNVSFTPRPSPLPQASGIGSLPRWHLRQRLNRACAPRISAGTSETVSSLTVRSATIRATVAITAYVRHAGSSKTHRLLIHAHEKRLLIARRCWSPWPARGGHLHLSCFHTVKIYVGCCAYGPTAGVVRRNSFPCRTPTTPAALCGPQGVDGPKRFGPDRPMPTIPEVGLQLKTRSCQWRNRSALQTAPDQTAQRNRG
jgi:hypothetical protein